MGTLLRSWALTKQSLAVAVENPELLMFPLFSAFTLLVVDAPLLPEIGRLSVTHPSASAYGMLLVVYCASNFVIIFFNSALMAAVAMHLDGEEATVGDGLRVAARSMMEILAWSLVAGTVGLAIRVLEDRLGKARVIGRIVEAAWPLATFFIIPVIIFEGGTDFQALRRSADLFKRQWGTEVAGGLGLSAVFFVLAIPAAVVSLVTLVVAPGLAIAVAGMSVLALYLLHEAVEGVFVVALYRYAATGAAAGSFTSEQLQSAFARKDAGWVEVDLSQIAARPAPGSGQPAPGGQHTGGQAKAQPPGAAGPA
jgi:Family of unknown function (DUF6159)